MKIEKLRNLATIEPGYPFRNKIEETPEADTIVVQMKDIDSNQEIKWSTCTKSKLTGKKQPSFLIDGDILFAARGGKNYAAQVQHQNHDRGLAVAAPHFYVISTKTKTILPEYLSWFLNQSTCQKYFERNSEGTTTKSIRREILESTPIPVPETEHQRKIVQIAKIVQQEQRIASQLVKNGKLIMEALSQELTQN